MRRWKVAGGLLFEDDRVLLVANRRRNGSVDWSTPGGVVDEGETSLTALGREVTEETGLVVREWATLCWTVEVAFTDLDMDLTVEVHRAASFAGTLRFDDPDGIVHDGAFLSPADARERLDTGPPWVAEPLREWLAAPWSTPRRYRFRARGEHPGALVTERLAP